MYNNLSIKIKLAEAAVMVTNLDILWKEPIPHEHAFHNVQIIAHTFQGRFNKWCITWANQKCMFLRSHLLDNKHTFH